MQKSNDTIGACKTHPTYKVLRKPRADCVHCHKLWIEHLSGELVEAEERTSQWRNLALQFDRHRMQAMALIRLAANGEATQDQLAAFAAAPPIPGHEITERLQELEDIVDKAWKSSHALDHNAYIPFGIDAWKRPVKQFIPYDFSGNPGASATQYCNGWNDAGGYWKAYAVQLEERIKLYEQVHKEDVYALDKLSEAESRYIKAEAQLESANDRAFRASEAHVVTMGKLKEAEAMISAVAKFPTMLRKMWSGGEVQRWIHDHVKLDSERLSTDSGRNPFYEGQFEGETEDECKSRLDHYNNPKGLIGYARKTEVAPLLDERMPEGGYIHIGIDHPTLWVEDTAYAHLVPIFADHQSDVADALNEMLMCPYVLEDATIPKSGISSAPPGQIVGTLHVSLTRMQKVRDTLKKYYHRMGEGA